MNHHELTQRGEPSMPNNPLLKPRWILTTVLVIAAAVVMVRLGFWQLDRLAQRKDHNARLSQGLAQPPLDLNGALPPDLTAMEFRSAVVSGRYDPSQEILLRNQYSAEGAPGFHLITPLLIANTNQVILVDRGWIPLDQQAVDQRSVYDQLGTVTVTGMLRRSQPEPVFGAAPDPQLGAGQTRLDNWIFVNLERIRLQVDRPLLDVFLVAAPDASASALPQRTLPVIDLSEGPHLDYAIQWFLFTATLLIGYPFYVRSQLRPRKPKR
jgi:surfeit locus 1 family protein